MSESDILLNGRELTLVRLARIAREGHKVRAARPALKRIATARKIVDDAVNEGKPVYGLTTGLGSRVVHALPREALAEFSRVTLRGRANSFGPALPADVVRAAMAARLNGLLNGGAGARVEVVEALIAALNAGFLPQVPETGSIGAGDLCQLAHIGLALIGEGEALSKGAVKPAKEALADLGLAPLELGPKDGLALCNASSMTAGRAGLALLDAMECIEVAQIAAALALEGFRGNLSPFDRRVITARPQPGQAEAAAGILRLLAGGDITQPGAARRLQDPISFRCIAQIHGGALAAIRFAEPSVDAEINGASDNPLIIPEDGIALSTGNFQTPLLAVALDAVSATLGQLAALSISRCARLMAERMTDLPGNLSPHYPTHSGFAPLLKTTEALLQEIRHLALPGFADLRWGADNVEDDLTNSPLAARKLADIIPKLRLILAAELTVAAQAVDLRGQIKLGAGTAKAQGLVREVIAPLDEDRPMSGEITQLCNQIIANGRLLGEVDGALMDEANAPQA